MTKREVMSRVMAGEWKDSYRGVFKKEGESEFAEAVAKIRRGDYALVWDAGRVLVCVQEGKYRENVDYRFGSKELVGWIKGELAKQGCFVNSDRVDKMLAGLRDYMDMYCQGRFYKLMEAVRRGMVTLGPFDLEELQYKWDYLRYIREVVLGMRHKVVLVGDEVVVLGLSKNGSWMVDGVIERGGYASVRRKYGVIPHIVNGVMNVRGDKYLLRGKRGLSRKSVGFGETLLAVLGREGRGIWCLYINRDGYSVGLELYDTLVRDKALSSGKKLVGILNGYIQHKEIEFYQGCSY